MTRPAFLDWGSAWIKTARGWVLRSPDAQTPALSNDRVNSTCR